MHEWIRIRHPDTRLTAVVTRRSFEDVHSKPENGGWELELPDPEPEVFVDEEDKDDDEGD